MSSSSTQTSTFTVVDIRKVVESFSADIAMIAQATGLMTTDTIYKTVGDLRIFAENKLITSVSVYLSNPSGETIRAAIYKVSESASGWSNDRPGDNLWPKTLGGELWVIATFTDVWWKKTEEEKLAFKKATGLDSIWVRNTKDTSVSGLERGSSKQYSSKDYGWERKNFGV